MLKVARRLRLLPARVGATFLWLMSDCRYCIHHIWIMYSGFSEENLCKQRATVNVAISKLLDCPDVPRYALKHIIFLEKYLGNKHSATIARKGLSFLFVRYEKGITDDEDMLAALLIDYSIRFAWYLDGKEVGESAKAGIERAAEYLVHFDPSTEKAAIYRALVTRLE